MRAGKLRNRIRIEKPVEARTSTGAIDVSWLTFADLWAEIDPKNGKESFKSDQYHEFLDVVFGCRHSPGVIPKMRVKYGSRYFNIKSILNPLERNERMLIGAQEIGSVGISEQSFSDEFTAEFA